MGTTTSILAHRSIVAVAATVWYCEVVHNVVVAHVRSLVAKHGVT